MAMRSVFGRAQARLTTKLLAALLCLTVAAPASAQSLACLRGANVAGAEFGDTVGKLGTTHFYPTQKTLTYLAGKGMNIVRFPFKWERLQPELYGPLDDRELTQLLESVALARKLGFTVILDPHTNARFAGKQIGSPEVPTAAFVDFWRRMSAFHASDPQVMFELQNEPDYMDAAFWLPSVNAAIAAIRENGADNMILVPGTIWTSAYHWFAEQNGGSNADVMSGVIDPLNNFAFDIHQYPDHDFSGTNRTCPATDTAVASLSRVTEWLKATGNRALLGEFGGTASPDCLDAIGRMAGFINDNPDTWIGWTYWAAGDWWGDYPLSIQPDDNGIERPQMRVVQRYILDPATGRIPACASLAPAGAWQLRGPEESQKGSGATDAPAR